MDRGETAAFATRSSLRADLAGLGLEGGDAVMVHAALSRLGSVLGGPDTVIAALRDAVGREGTILAYADWDAGYEALVDERGRVPERWRDDVPPFDPATSRASRDNGVFPEFLRTTPGALRSGSPGASVVALGAEAEALTSGHPLDYGYGEGSPFARLAATGGRVLMLGAPLDTMTLLHHAEHLAQLPGKRVKRVEVPYREGGATRWRMIEEFDTSAPVVEGLSDDVIEAIVRDFLATGGGREGRVAAAPCVLVDAAPMLRFAVAWLEERCGAGAIRR